MGREPMGIAGGDFDADGDVDLATADYMADTLSILFNGGSGSFGAPRPAP